MTTEENKRLIRRLYDELINKGNLDVVEELVHPDFVDYTMPAGWGTDREVVRRQVGYFRTAFPDLHVTIEETVAEDDKVWHRQTLRGTHQGEFFGIQPTGNAVTMTGTHCFRVKAGKIIEHRANNDDLGMLTQLGAIPPGW